MGTHHLAARTEPGRQERQHLFVCPPHSTRPSNHPAVFGQWGREVPGSNRSPLSSGSETTLHPHTTVPNTHCHRLLIFLPLWADFCTVLSINQFPGYLLQNFQEFVSFQQWHHSREMWWLVWPATTKKFLSQTHISPATGKAEMAPAASPPASASAQSQRRHQPPTAALAEPFSVSAHLKAPGGHQGQRDEFFILPRPPHTSSTHHGNQNLWVTPLLPGSPCFLSGVLSYPFSLSFFTLLLLQLLFDPLRFWGSKHFIVFRGKEILWLKVKQQKKAL